MKMLLLLVCLAELVCACTAHAVRCDGHLQRINAPGAASGSAPAPGAGSASGVP